jgi:hypothetical protein
MVLASCSSDEQIRDASYKAHEAYQRCVEDSSRDLGRPEETTIADAIAAVNRCERQLRVAAYLQAKKRAGKGDYRNVGEVAVYREWKDGLRNLALCRLSTNLEPERCLTTD